MDMDKLDRLVKLLSAAEKLQGFPGKYSELNARIQQEAEQLGKELGADTDKKGPGPEPMRSIPTASPTERKA